MNSARNFVTLTIVLLLIALSTEAVTAQQRAKRGGWDYCAITNSTSYSPDLSRPDAKASGIASVCYFQSDGCKREDFKVEISLAEFAKSFDPRENPGAISYAASNRAAEMALAKAVAKLGSDGWEMVGQSIFRFNMDKGADAIYFKRGK